MNTNVRTSLRALAALAAASTCCVASSRATSLFTQNFESFTSTGNTTNSGTSTLSLTAGSAGSAGVFLGNNGAATFSIVSPGISYKNGEATGSTTVSTNANLDGLTRALQLSMPTSANGATNTRLYQSTGAINYSTNNTVWFSITLQFSNYNTDDFLQFALGNYSTASASNENFFTTNSASFRFTNSGVYPRLNTSGSTSVNPASGTSIGQNITNLGQKLFVVGRLTSTDGTNFNSLSIWANPANVTSVGSLGTSFDVTSNSVSLTSITGIGIRTGSASLQASPKDYVVQFDNILIGTTLADVTSASAIPEPSAYACVLGLGVLTLGALRRSRRNPLL